MNGLRVLLLLALGTASGYAATIGLLGALDVSCGPVSVEARSWARIEEQDRSGAR